MIASWVARAIDVRLTWVYVLLGLGVWFGLHDGGVHPTIAGVLMGVLAPSTPRGQTDLIDIDDLGGLPDIEVARTTSQRARDTVSTVEWLLHVLHPWSSYLIVPIFALANAGISISIGDLGDAFGSPITWGVGLGLLLGKPLGVVLATRLTIGSGVSDTPRDTASRHLLGVGNAAGIGFTVALFITELALDDPIDQRHAKLAILLASVTAAIVASVVLRTGGRSPQTAGDEATAHRPLTAHDTV